MIQLTKPYWYKPSELPGLDFNRQIVSAGTKDEFPDGAVGIYVDDNFWCVAALPLDPYTNKTIEEIVAELWPTYKDQATYTPDDGSDERFIWFLKREAEYERTARREIEKQLMNLQAEVERLRRGRTDMVLRSSSKLELRNSYFVRQYEHLLIATAHVAIPKKDLPGVCSICNLLNTDRVHQEKWIEKHNVGYAPDMRWHGDAEE